MIRKTARQKEAIALLTGDARHILLFGGSRSGKTFLLVYALIVRALKAKSRHLILRLRFNHVKTSVWHDTLPKVVKLICPEVKLKWNYADFFVRFPNSSEIWIGGLDDKERTEKILGTEYSTILFNECSQLTYDSVQMALPRLAEKTELVNKAYYDCNPPSKKHWTYLTFIEKIEPETKQKHIQPELYATLLMNPADNQENLPEGYIETILQGLSRRKRERFLLGLWRDEVEGALWKEEDILRIAATEIELERIVIGIDPAASVGDDSDETGIIIAGKMGNKFIVLEDLSGQFTPHQWAKRAIEAYDEWKADLIVGEVNNGGDMVETIIKTINSTIPFKKVWASRGKAVRAEPIEALYEQGRGYHCGIFPELEDQMTSWEAGKTRQENGFSPDRLDALVWAGTELMLQDKKFIFV